MQRPENFLLDPKVAHLYMTQRWADAFRNLSNIFLSLCLGPNQFSAVFRAVFVELNTIDAVLFPGCPRDRCASADPAPFHRRQWGEDDHPALHVLHSEGKELLVQKLGAGHHQN